MAKYCFITECKHNSRHDKCKFFRFPTNEVECRMWNDAVAQDRQGTFINRLCSCHFENGLRAYGPNNIIKLRGGESKNVSQPGTSAVSQAGTSAVSEAADGSEQSSPNLSLTPRFVPIRPKSRADDDSRKSSPNLLLPNRFVPIRPKSKADDRSQKSSPNLSLTPRFFPLRPNPNETADNVSSPNLCLPSCFVPMCSNTYETVGKVFIPFPKDLTMRNKWCDAIQSQVSISARAFCCSDHFDLAKDMENYTKWCSMPGTTIEMKPSVVPHIFTCQGISSHEQKLEQRRKLHVERLLRVRIEERNQELLKESSLLQNKVAARNRELHETGRVITANEEIAEERLIRERIEMHNQELLEGSQRILEENGKTLDQLVEENLRESELLWNPSSGVDQSEECNNVEVKEEAQDDTEVECSLGQMSDGAQSFVSIKMNVVNHQASQNSTIETEADVEIKQEYPEENIGDSNMEVSEFLDVRIKEEIDDTAFNNNCNEDENDLTDGNSYTASQHHVEFKEETDGEFNLDVKDEYQIVDRSEELDEENQCHGRIRLEHDYYKAKENTQGPPILQTEACNVVIRKKVKLKRLLSRHGNQSDSFLMLKTDAVKYILDENGGQGQRRCFLMKNVKDFQNDLYEVFETGPKTVSDGDCQVDFSVEKKDESVQCLRKRKMVDVSISPMKRSVDASTSCMESNSESSSELSSESSCE
uniref:THAP-type domain-containing protein n=1 Tax=Cacopsylla melanoneura TaxID=428564 RepID=A0A8D9ED90_9HEMI